MPKIGKLASGLRASYGRVGSAGFTLIEIAVVLVIITLLAVTIGGTMVGQVAARKFQETDLTLQRVESALTTFVTTTRRLPCPADGSLPSSAANFGLEQRTGAGATTTCPAMANGVVPWRTIGLTQAEVADGWLNLITYRVPLHLAMDNGMTMSDCDPAGTGASTAGTPFHMCVNPCVGTNLAGCTDPANYLFNKGLTIQNIAGTVLANPAAVAPATPTGAAFVLISHGPTLGPAYNLQGNLLASTGTLGTAEGMNQNGQALQAFYVDDAQDNTNSTAHFDDIVRRPSVATVIAKANLGPRAH